MEKLEIRVNKNKRWSQNLLNLHVYFQDEKAKSKHSNWFANFRINQKYKKKFKSIILVKYKGFKSCYFNSMIRVTGDLWWHIGWNRGTPVSSLHVEILDGLNSGDKIVAEGTKKVRPNLTIRPIEKGAKKKQGNSGWGKEDKSKNDEEKKGKFDWLKNIFKKTEKEK